MSDKTQLFTSEQLAAILGISVNTLYAYKSAAFGKIKIKPENGEKRSGWLYTKDECIQAIQERQKISSAAAEIVFSDRLNTLYNQ